MLDLNSLQQSPNQGSGNFLQSPQALALAAGLLEGGAPSLTPTSFGKALGMGFQNMANATNNQVNQNYIKTKTQNEAIQGKLQALQLQRQLAMFDQTMKMFGLSPDGSNLPASSQLSKQTSAPINPFPNTYGPPMPQGMLANLGDNSQGSGLLNSNPQSSSDSLFDNVDPVTAQHAKMLLFSGQPDKAIDLIYKNYSPNTTFPGGINKDQTNSPARGGKGGTYSNPNGQIISTNTPERTTQDQTTISAIDRANPQIDQLINVMPQFQRGPLQLKAKLAGLSNSWLGTNYNLPSQQAKGEAIIEAAPESLLKGFGLNVTDESLKSMRAVINPKDGESPEGYKQRLLGTLTELKTFQDQAKQRLATGTDVTPTSQTANQQYSDTDLQNMAHDAISKGADPKAVQARINQIKGIG